MQDPRLSPGATAAKLTNENDNAMSWQKGTERGERGDAGHHQLFSRRQHQFNGLFC